MDTVYITKDARDRLFGFVDVTKDEIGGMGYAILDNGNLIWTDTFLVPQIAGSAEVDFGDHGGGFAYAIEKAIEDNVLDREDFVWVKWHSHHSMAAYWSSTDDDANDKMHAAGVEVLLDCVVNKKREFKVRLELYDVKPELAIPRVTMDNLKLALDPVDQYSLGIEEEFKEFVKERPKTHGTSWTSGKKSDDLPGEKVEGALAERAGYSEYDLDDEEWQKVHGKPWAISREDVQAWSRHGVLDDTFVAELELAGYDIVDVEGEGRFVVESGQVIAELSASGEAAAV